MNVAAGAGAAFVYGIVGSLHCAAMCGPLCCAFLSARPASAADAPGDRSAASGPGPVSHAARAATLQAALVYSATRVLAYAALGAVAGALGQGASALVGAVTSRWSLVVFATLLGGVALPWEIAWPRITTGLRLPARALGRAADLLLGIPRSARGAFLGLATPLLPCGFLYGALAGAISTGSLAGGLVTMLAFALGTVPILVLLIAGADGLALRLSGRMARRLQQAVALAAAAGLLYIASLAPPPPHPPEAAASSTATCPLCDSATAH